MTSKKVKTAKSAIPKRTARKKPAESGSKRKRASRRKFVSSNSVQESPITVIETFTARELQKKDFPPIRYAVEGYFSEGLVLLGGKPKIGKSWMALNVAMAVATGGLALGSVPCRQGVALYAALEDNQRRLQRRMRQLYGDKSRWPMKLYFTTQMQRLDNGGTANVRGWILRYRPRVIIIDTLACVRPHRRGRGTGYDEDYAALAPLQELAGELGICIIVIHHLRKEDSDDPLDTISGTTGLTGAVDTIMVLRRDGGGLTLYGRGREIEDFEVALELNHGVWKFLGPASEVRLSDERKAITDVLENSDEPLSPNAIASALNKPTNNIKQLLFNMLKDGEIVKPSRGRYCMPAK